MTAGQYSADLKAAAYHEVGHLTVARWHGVPGRIELQDTVEPGRWDKLLTAYIVFSMDFPSAASERQMALAGMMAERILAGDDWDAIEEGACEWVLSESDADGAAGWDADDLAECHRILTECWVDVCGLAAATASKHLIETGRMW